MNSGGIFSQRYLEKHRPLWSATHSTDTALNHDRSVILPATDNRLSADNERAASKGLRTNLAHGTAEIKTKKLGSRMVLLKSFPQTSETQLP